MTKDERTYIRVRPYMYILAMQGSKFTLVRSYLRVVCRKGRVKIVTGLPCRTSEFPTLKIV